MAGNFAVQSLSNTQVQVQGSHPDPSRDAWVFRLRDYGTAQGKVDVTVTCALVP